MKTTLSICGRWLYHSRQWRRRHDRCRRRGDHQFHIYVLHAEYWLDASLYRIAKAGIVGLTKGLAGRLGPDNIRVNAIAPGWVMTERSEGTLGDGGRSRRDGRPAMSSKSPIEPDDMVGPCLFLASSAAAMITAQVLIADGGMM
jgi:NAD(P)-dependent dehydrogenase (short-subunit alcohol dehydrogenase family)